MILLKAISFVFLDIPYDPNATALDFGSGPSIIGAMCASRCVPTIVCADLLENCQKELSKWLNNETDAFNWFPYAKHFSNKENIR